MAHHEQEAAIMNEIEEGMAVVDRDGDELGKVGDLYLGTSDGEAATLGEIDEAVPARDPYPEGLFERVAEAFAGRDDMPEELRERLLNKGFIVIDPGLIGPTRFASSESIERVEEGRVYLRAAGDDLYEI